MFGTKADAKSACQGVADELLPNKAMSLKDITGILGQFSKKVMRLCMAVKYVFGRETLWDSIGILMTVSVRNIASYLDIGAYDLSCH